MGYIENIKKYKEEIKEMILSNQNLLKLLYYPSASPLEEKNINNASGLLNKYIFFRFRNPETIENKTSFIVVNIKANKFRNQESFINIRIYFDIFTDNMIINLDNGNDRFDCIAEEINKMMNGAKGEWIGQAKLRNDMNFLVSSNMNGRRLVYEISDFNGRVLV